MWDCPFDVFDGRDADGLDERVADLDEAGACVGGRFGNGDRQFQVVNVERDLHHVRVT